VVSVWFEGKARMVLSSALVPVSVMVGLRCGVLEGTICWGKEGRKGGKERKCVSSKVFEIGNASVQVFSSIFISYFLLSFLYFPYFPVC
jgi:hypothetical protein